MLYQNTYAEIHRVERKTAHLIPMRSLSLWLGERPRGPTLGSINEIMRVFAVLRRGER